MQVLEDINTKLKELRDMGKDPAELNFWETVAPHMTQVEQTELLMTLNEEVDLLSEMQK